MKQAMYSQQVNQNQAQFNGSQAPQQHFSQLGDNGQAAQNMNMAMTNANNNNIAQSQYSYFTQTQGPLPEPLLEENPNRFVILPIKYNDIWKMYKD